MNTGRQKAVAEFEMGNDRGSGNGEKWTWACFEVELTKVATGLDLRDRSEKEKSETSDDLQPLRLFCWVDGAITC